MSIQVQQVDGWGMDKLVVIKRFRVIKQRNLDGFMFERRVPYIAWSPF